MSISKLACWTIGAIIAVEAASFFSFLDPQQAGAWAFGIVVVAALVLIIRKLEYGVMLIFSELVIGSFGRMLELSINGFDVSIRMALWLIVIMAWLGRAIQKRRIEFYHSPLFKPYLALAAVLGWGIVWGLIRGNSLGLIFSDVNNYLYFALIFPVYDVLCSSGALRRVGAVIGVAMGYLAAKTIALFYIFSHELFGLQDALYTWSRHSHLAEITNVDPSAILSRVFMQSQIWLVFGVFVGLALLFPLLTKEGTKGRSVVAQDPLLISPLVRGRNQLAALVGLLILSLAAIIASFSRSFWLAMIIAFVVLAIALFVVMRERIKTVGRFIAITAVTGVLAVGLVIITMQFPIPAGNADADLIKNRAGKFTGEAAVSSRYAQIRPLLESIKNHPVVGAGFGTGVTYQSQDPRVLKNNPDGNYTTTAFELGWLAMWLKIGLVGVGAYVYLLWRILRLGWQHIKATRIYELHPNDPKTIRNNYSEYSDVYSGHSDRFLLLGALAGLIAVALTHGVSPYLNHPLGIGVVILVTGLVDKQRE